MKHGDELKEPPRWQLTSEPELTDKPAAAPEPPPPDSRGQQLMFCPRCGFPTDGARELCTKCGARSCLRCGE